jgi:hypothetical protein
MIMRGSGTDGEDDEKIDRVRRDGKKKKVCWETRDESIIGESESINFTSIIDGCILDATSNGPKPLLRPGKKASRLCHAQLPRQGADQRTHAIFPLG